MKITCLLKITTIIALQILILPPILEAQQVLSSENRYVSITAPQTIVNVKVKDEGIDTLRYFDVNAKGWVCGKNFTDETLKIIARLNIATNCYVKDSVNGSPYGSFKEIEEDTVALGKSMIKSAKNGDEIDFSKENRIPVYFKEADPDNYTATYEARNCYTEDDIKKLIEARVDAAKALITAYENWKKMKEEEQLKKQEKK